MRKTFSLLLLFTLTLLGVQAQQYAQRENTQRLMSFNIHHGEGMDGKMDITRVGDVILSVNPEAVALQEIDSVVNRSGNINTMQLLAQQTGMHPTFGHSILHDGGKYGNGMLTKEKPVAVNKISLPGADEARTALIVDTRIKTPADQVMRTIPYLQNPGTDEMTIMWLTNVPARRKTAR